MANRFTKERCITDLIDHAEAIRTANNFDSNNGTAQLKSGKCTDQDQELINKAVAYGRWRATQDVATWIDDGRFGVKDNQSKKSQ